MKKRRKIEHHIYRIPPCPAYDISGMENWLSDLAEEGLFLVQDGFFAGVAAFEYRKPRQVRYRLEAAQRKTGMLSDNSGEPDPEQVELSKKYSWEYIAKRKDFYIYRSFDPSARELNTDPEVQALALNAVKKRQGSALLSSVFFLFIYPVLLTRGCIMLTAIKILSRELYRLDMMKKGVELIDAPNLQADYVIAYFNTLRFPTVVIQKDNIVVKAFFFQTSENYTIPIEEWADMICDSLEN